MTKVLVSGAQEHVAAVAEALAELGAEVTGSTDLTGLPSVVEAHPEGFDSYVQLGVNFVVEGTTAIGRVHHFFADGVLARFTALGAVLAGAKRPGRVVFVMGKLPPEVATPADREARHALTEVLAQAARADLAPAPLEVHILEASTPAAEIARTALGRAERRRAGTVADDRGLEGDLEDLRYEDWRVEILGLAQLQT